MTVATDINIELQEVLDGVSNDLFNVELDPLVVKLERDIEKLHADIFLLEMSPSGDFWEELAESTAEAKGHAIILEDLGDLLQSLTFGGMSDAIRQRHTTLGQAVLFFGTEDEKSPFHMTGTKTMPRREHIGLNDIFVDEVLVIDVADYVVEELKEV